MDARLRVRTEKVMRAFFWDPYLNSLGGGEKYILDIANVLHSKGYECTFAWPENEIKQLLISRFGNKYDFISIDTAWNKSSLLRRIQLTGKNDVFFYQPDGSYPVATARKNFALMQVPTKKLLPTTLFGKIKFSRFIPLFNSRFTKRYFSKQIKCESAPVVYPPVSDDCFQYAETKKEKMILSVGRFFTHLHAKRQDVLIDAFVKGQKKYPLLRDYSLILAGANEDAAYVQKLKKKCDGNTKIHIMLDVDRSTILHLYQSAQFYWHAAGFGIDQEKYPEQVEHFGIAPIEAMAAGAVPILYNAGGPRETVLDKKTGFLFEDRSELVDYTVQLIRNQKERTKMAQRAVERVKEKFSIQSLEEKLTPLL